MKKRERGRGRERKCVRERGRRIERNRESKTERNKLFITSTEYYTDLGKENCLMVVQF